MTARQANCGRTINTINKRNKAAVAQPGHRHV